MKTRTLCPCLLLIVVGMFNATFAEPPEMLRIAIQAENRSVSPDRAATFTSAVGYWLRERAVECSSFQLISMERNAAVIGNLLNPAAPMPVAEVFAAYNRIQPIDAYVHYALAGDMIEVIIYRAGEVKQTTFSADFAGKNTKKQRFDVFLDLSGITLKTVQFIAESLPISSADKAIITGKRIENPLIASSILNSRSLPQPRHPDIRNFPQHQVLAEMRLRRLSETWQMAPRNPYVADIVMFDTCELFAADPDVRRETYLVSWVKMAQESMPAALGRTSEAIAYIIAQIAPKHFLRQTLEMARPLLNPVDLLDNDDPLADPGGGLGGLAQELTSQLDKFGQLTRENRLGAVRLLGFLPAPETLKLLADGLSSPEPDVRAASAFAISRLPRTDALKLLAPLRNDSNPRVRFWALQTLEPPGRQNPELLKLAGQFISEPFPLGDTAAQLVCARAGSAEVKFLRQLLQTSGRHRPAAAAALLRSSEVAETELLALLNDYDAAVIISVLNNLPELNQDSLIMQELKRLVNDPFQPLAEAARQALGTAGPQDIWQRQELLLSIEHPYLRSRILDRLAESKAPEARRLLRAACGNNDPQTRAKALQLLARLDPAAAREPCAAALGDRHFWVRFHACAIAAEIADADMADSIRQVLEQETDAITRSYLEEALAKAAGTPPPELPTPARSIKGERNLTWNTSPGTFAAESPFDAYYSMTPRVNAHMRAAHEAGKIIFARATPISVAAGVVLDLKARDDFWQELDRQLLPDNIKYFDGLIYGEETMSIIVQPLWESAWRLFCVDAGIAPKTVAGDFNRLEIVQQRAWQNWIIARHVEGFNILYDYTKLRFGRVRPGLQVATFLPGEKLPYPGSPDAIKNWKFDVGGIYDYKGDNRMAAYNMIRRYKTIWPDREVIWLSLGIGGYEMNPVFHDHKAPTKPLLDRYNRSFADALTAWIAGGDTGWFSTWIFMSTIKGSTKSMSRLRGVHFWVEDIAAKNSVIDRATNYLFRGIDIAKEDLPDAPSMAELRPSLELPIAPELDDLDEVLDDAGTKRMEQKQTELDQEIEKKRELLKDGFLYYQKYVYDCARIFASLPRLRLRLRPQALGIQGGVNIWVTPRYNAPVPVPALDLLNNYDYLCDVNMLGVLDPEHYRLIVVHAPETVDSRTVRALDNWLKTTPGVLVIHHGWPDSRNPESKAGTPDDHSEKLDIPWPWEDAVQQHEFPLQKGDDKLINSAGIDFSGILESRENRRLYSAAFSGNAPAFRALLKVEDKNVLAVWQGDGYQGSVIFDGVTARSKPYQEFLRNNINQFLSAGGAEYQVTAPALMSVLNTPEIDAAASSLYFRATKEQALFKGVDIMNGDINPDAGGTQGSRSSLVLKNYINRFVAGTPYLAALGEKPFTFAKQDGEALILENDGYIRVAGITGNVTVETEDGQKLPEIPELELTDWLFYRRTPGIVRHKRRAGLFYTYLRSPGLVTVRPAVAE